MLILICAADFRLMPADYLPTPMPRRHISAPYQSLAIRRLPPSLLICRAARAKAAVAMLARAEVFTRHARTRLQTVDAAISVSFTRHMLR